MCAYLLYCYLWNIYSVITFIDSNTSRSVLYTCYRATYPMIDFGCQFAFAENLKFLYTFKVHL